MAPSLRYPFNGRTFYTDQETKPISEGVVLWRGYFQSVRPAVNRLLININISTGAMYQPGDLLSLCLNFLDHSRRPNALAASQLPGRERVRLQRFITGVKVTTPYRTHDPDRLRFVKRLTRESAQDRAFDTRDGQTMTVMEFFEGLNIQLQFPDLICVEVCTTLLYPGALSHPVARVGCCNPTGALRSPTRSAGSQGDVLGSDQVHTRVL